MADWQDMESALKDGTPVLLWSGTASVVASWNGERPWYPVAWYVQDQRGGNLVTDTGQVPVDNPQCWAKLPEGPTVG